MRLYAVFSQQILIVVARWYGEHPDLPYPCPKEGKRLVGSAHEWLIKQGMIDSSADIGCFKVTERGRRWLDRNKDAWRDYTTPCNETPKRAS